MPRKIVVQQGDSVAQLAGAHGHFYQTIWDDPANAELRAKRQYMNVLAPGDVVTIPDLRQKEIAISTDRRHVFRRRGVPAMFRLQVVRNGKPRAQERFVLTVDGVVHEGTTDADGKIEVYVPTGAAAGTLELGDEGPAIAVRFGQLDPTALLCGVQKRLLNIGLYEGPLDGQLTRETSDALLDFQRSYGLPQTGEADDATCAKLVAVHDSVNANFGEPVP
jgi:N-acetylmuramoyl-L-alanine amidase